jgi:Flp pilus assembly protein TadB
MNLGTILIIVGTFIGVSAMLALLAMSALGNKRKQRVRELVSGVMASSTSSATAGQKKKKKMEIEDVEELKKRTREAKEKERSNVTSIITRPGNSSKQSLALAGKLFQAGYFSNEDREFFQKFQVIAPFVCSLLAALLMISIAEFSWLTGAAVLIGAIAGISLPQSILERQIRARTDEILFYLPLAIEQISIGVSSALDMWPCITQIIQTSKERDTINPVIELFSYVERLVASGLSLQDSLSEVSQASGVQQVKHTFKFLAQCAEHGGEISKQLQDLADSVMAERQYIVEAKIAGLPVKATGPLFMVFAGFFVLLLSGVFTRLTEQLGNMGNMGN